MPKKTTILAALALILLAAVPACARQATETPDEEETTTETLTVTGVIEKPQITTYTYGTHAVTDENSGTRFALESEEEGLLDGYTGRRVVVYGDPVPGYENGAVEGGPPLLNVTRVESASSTEPTNPTREEPRKPR